MSAKMINLSQFSALTKILYQATLDHSKWSEFVGSLTYVTGVSQSFMIGVGGETQVPFTPVTPNLDPEYFSNYIDHYRHHDLWLSSMPKLGVGKVWESDEVIGRRKVVQSVFYNEWLRPQEDILKGLAMVVAKNSERTVVLGANIRRIDHSRVEENWVDTVNALMPHLHQAFSMSTVIGQDKLNRLLKSKGQSRFVDSAILIVGEQANLVYSNDAAKNLLQNNKVVATGVGGKLRFVDVDCSLQFHSALRGLKLDAADVPRTALHVDFVFGSFEVRIARLDPFDPPFPFSISIGDPALLVTIARQGIDFGVAAILQTKFALTPTEAMVVEGFSGGKSLRTIADEKRVSIHTVRNQIKAAMQKLGVRNQAQLVLLLQCL